MLERIESPDGVLAFRAVGTIEQTDYEYAFAPEVERMIAERGEVRLVYILGDEFVGYSPMAGWEDTKLGVGHRSKWRRVAIVTNHDWVRHAVTMLRWVVPAECKVFDLSEERGAMTWAAW